MEFELAYYYVTVLQVNHSPTMINTRSFLLNFVRRVFVQLT